MSRTKIQFQKLLHRTELHEEPELVRDTNRQGCTVSLDYPSWKVQQEAMPHSSVFRQQIASIAAASSTAGFAATLVAKAIR